MYHFLPSLITALMLKMANAQVVIDRVADNFAWSDPFGAYATPPGFENKCEATANFHATQHVIREAHQPPPVGLAPWIDAIKYFFGGRPFPGSWDGVDSRGINREVIMMEYAEVPKAVKDWILEQQKEDGDTKWLFGIYEKPKNGGKIGGTAKIGSTSDDLAGLAPEDLVVLFAAGAIYEILPLWVAAESDCKADLLDLSKYSPTPKDESVVAWVVERTVPDWDSKSRDIKFKIKAQVLTETAEARAARIREEKMELAESSEDSMATPPVDAPSVAKDEL
ncbi:phenylacetaldoxime dehydratase [Colletotrichum truncatum]|uniref:Phenylacetaldoxime dehydratase n=1 Tax=Colletotrichum truncatum TaxID=5467 RepID=A0ACC3YKJ1_COLTU|nr:phenylacetaldoxime dehydratase [Colletotrichum truncatum]KAF6797467.1 phenylacetaldoxime dehydratase [Colletotrichum truncatum]